MSTSGHLLIKDPNAYISKLTFHSERLLEVARETRAKAANHRAIGRDPELAAGAPNWRESHDKSADVMLELAIGAEGLASILRTSADAVRDQWAENGQGYTVQNMNLAIERLDGLQLRAR